MTIVLVNQSITLAPIYRKTFKDIPVIRSSHSHLTLDHRRAKLCFQVKLGSALKITEDVMPVKLSHCAENIRKVT